MGNFGCLQEDFVSTLGSQQSIDYLIQNNLFKHPVQRLNIGDSEIIAHNSDEKTSTKVFFQVLIPFLKSVNNQLLIQMKSDFDKLSNTVSTQKSDVEKRIDLPITINSKGNMEIKVTEDSEYKIVELQYTIRTRFNQF